MSKHTQIVVQKYMQHKREQQQREQQQRKIINNVLSIYENADCSGESRTRIEQTIDNYVSKGLISQSQVDNSYKILKKNRIWKEIEGLETSSRDHSTYIAEEQNSRPSIIKNLKNTLFNTKNYIKRKLNRTSPEQIRSDILGELNRIKTHQAKGAIKERFNAYKVNGVEQETHEINEELLESIMKRKASVDNIVSEYAKNVIKTKNGYAMKEDIGYLKLGTDMENFIPYYIENALESFVENPNDWTEEFIELAAKTAEETRYNNIANKIRDVERSGDGIGHLLRTLSIFNNESETRLNEFKNNYNMTIEEIVRNNQLIKRVAGGIYASSQNISDAQKIAFKYLSQPFTITIDPNGNLRDETHSYQNEDIENLEGLISNNNEQLKKIVTAVFDDTGLENEYSQEEIERTIETLTGQSVNLEDIYSTTIEEIRNRNNVGGVTPQRVYDWANKQNIKIPYLENMPINVILSMVAMGVSSDPLKTPAIGGKIYEYLSASADSQEESIGDLLNMSKEENDKYTKLFGRISQISNQ